MTNKLKLNQVVAIVKGAKQDAERKKSDLYKIIQRTGAFDGLAKTYRPLNEDGERLPEESKLVQAQVPVVLREFRAATTRRLDVMYTQEDGNTHARADVVLPDGKVVLENVPATYLLALERELVDVRTFVTKLPVLSTNDVWSLDANTGNYVTSVTETARTKKVPRVLEKYPATDKHPAQVDVWHEDVLVGYWANQKISGAMPLIEREALHDRVNVLIDAVKKAREAANSVEVEDKHAGSALFDHLFGTVAVNAGEAPATT